MNKEDLLKKITVGIFEEGYYGNRIVRPGEKLVVKRHEFSPRWMVAIDAKGNDLEVQPKKIPNKTIIKIFEMAGTKKAETFPILEAADLKKSSKEGADDFVDDFKPEDTEDEESEADKLREEIAALKATNQEQTEQLEDLTTPSAEVSTAIVPEQGQAAGANLHV